MDRLASTKLFAAESKICDQCGMHNKKSHGCCRDEVKIIQLKVDQKVASDISFELPASDAGAHLPSLFISTSFINAPETEHNKSHPPPLITGQDIYLQNCVFRI
jgi:hypothetical protein